MKNYLRILIILLAFVTKANAQLINLELPRITASLGDTVTIPIQVSNLDSAVAFQLRFSYQSNSLRYIGYDSTGTSMQGSAFGVIDDSSSTRISYFQFSPISQNNGVLLNLKYIFMGSPSSLVWNQLQTEFTIGSSAVMPSLIHGTIGHSNTGVSITSFPSIGTFCESDTALFSLQATGAGAYQWQISTDTIGTSFANLIGATSETLSIPAVDRNT